MTPADIIARLEEAGATLLAMRLSGGSPASLKSAWPDVVHDASEAYGYTGEQVRPAFPASDAISRMDEALGWIPLIPPDRYVWRRVVGARALVSPRTARHLFTWRRIGAVLGCEPRAVRYWHVQAIALIAASLEIRNPIANPVQVVPRLPPN